MGTVTASKRWTTQSPEVLIVRNAFYELADKLEIPPEARRDILDDHMKTAPDALSGLREAFDVLAGRLEMTPEAKRDLLEKNAQIVQEQTAAFSGAAR